MTPRATRPRLLLACLALLLAMHPLSGAASADGAGIASLLKALSCGCVSCDMTPAETEPESCCDEPVEESDPECACGHPTDLPLPAPAPLCEAGSGGTGSAKGAVQRGAELSARTLAPCMPVATGPQPLGGPPGPRADEPGTYAPGVVDGVPKRLAVLCVSLT